MLPETNHGSNGNSSGNGVGKFDARKKSSSSTSLPDVEIQVPDKLGINSTAVNLAELNTEVMMPESTFPVAADEKLETDALIQITDPVVVITGSSVDTTEPDSVVILRNCFGICCFTWVSVCNYLFSLTQLTSQFSPLLYATSFVLYM